MVNEDVHSLLDEGADKVQGIDDDDPNKEIFTFLCVYIHA